MSRRQIYIVGLFCTAFFAVAVWLAWLPNTLDVLDSDDYAWYQSLFLMHDAVTGAASRGLIVSNTFYGWPFWLVNLAASFPFFRNGWENEAGVILTARFVGCAFAAASLALVLIAIRKEQLARKPQVSSFALLWIVPFLILMTPIWWAMCVRIHPQHMLFFLEMVSMLFLVTDRGKIGRAFWVAVVAAGAAMAIKIEALMMAPMFLVYLGSAAFCGTASVARAVRAGALGLPAAVAIFVALNPYLLSGRARAEWIGANFNNLSDLRHAGQHHGMGEAITHLAENYYVFPVICALLVALWMDAVRSWKRKQLSASQWLAPYILFALIFCIMFVTKYEPYYWLAPMVLLLFAFVPLGDLCRTPLYMALCAFLLVVQAIWPGPLTFKLFHDRQQELVASSPANRVLTLLQARGLAHQQGEALMPLLAQAARPIISPYSDVDFRSYGVRYIERIYDCLSWDDLRERIGRRLQLPAVDLVILRKNDPLIRAENCPDAARRIAEWRVAKAPDFRFLRETPYLLVFGTGKSGGGNYWNRLRKD